MTATVSVNAVTWQAMRSVRRQGYQGRGGKAVFEQTIHYAHLSYRRNGADIPMGKMRITREAAETFISMGVKKIEGR